MTLPTRLAMSIRQGVRTPLRVPRAFGAEGRLACPGNLSGREPGEPDSLTNIADPPEPRYFPPEVASKTPMNSPLSR